MIFARNKKFADKTRADFWTNLSPGGVGKSFGFFAVFGGTQQSKRAAMRLATVRSAGL